MLSLDAVRKTYGGEKKEKKRTGLCMELENLLLNSKVLFSWSFDSREIYFKIRTVMLMPTADRIIAGMKSLACSLSLKKCSPGV